MNLVWEVMDVVLEGFMILEKLPLCSKVEEDWIAFMSQPYRVQVEIELKLRLGLSLI